MSAIRKAVLKAGGQEKLAGVLGVTQGRISQWVAGQPIKTEYFKAIERATGVTAHELFADELKKPKQKPRRSAIA